MLTNTTISGANGYDLACLQQLHGGMKQVVLLCHGFGSSKDEPTTYALAERLAAADIGLLACDWPGHGQSPVNGAYLTVENCLNDLATLEQYARQCLPQAEILYFASSYGAYVTLIYLATRPHLGQRAVLRCAAVDMPGLFFANTKPEQFRELAEQGSLLVDHPCPMLLMPEYYGGLARHDLFQLCRPDMAELLFIHGERDRIALLEHAQRYCREFGAELQVIPGAGHNFLEPGKNEQVIEAAMQFYLRPPQPNAANE